jgi:phosphate transport system substrate-binding protein
MIKTLIFFITLLTGLEAFAEGREQIRIVGSSTLYPFITIVAEDFAKETGYRTPIIEVNGTGGGFNLFCKGVGEKYPDFNNASRPIKKSEIELCKKNGVNQIKEIKIGYDGIILAHSAENKDINFTMEELFLALAKEVPQDGKLVPNFYKTWDQINPRLPKYKIEVYGPSFTSGTRDAFVDLLMKKTCNNFSEYEKTYPDQKYREENCKHLREDGAYIEMGENDNLIVQKVALNNKAYGIIGYNYFIQNDKVIKAISINDTIPSFENILKSKYTLARPLFIYAKEEHINLTKGMKQFIDYLTDTKTIGRDSYLVTKGLIPIELP